MRANNRNADHLAQSMHQILHSDSTKQIFSKSTMKIEKQASAPVKIKSFAEHIMETFLKTSQQLDDLDFDQSSLMILKAAETFRQELEIFAHEVDDLEEHFDGPGDDLENWIGEHAPGNITSHHPGGDFTSGKNLSENEELAGELKTYQKEHPVIELDELDDIENDPDLIDLPDDLTELNFDEQPLDYETCGECGHDHSYEPEEAFKKHRRHKSDEADLGFNIDENFGV